MKKLYTLTLALASVMALSAKDFTVYHDGAAVSNGDKIVVAEPHNTTLPFGTKYEFNADLQFQGQSDGNVTVEGKQVGDIKDTSGVMSFSLCPYTCTYLENGVISNTFGYESANGKLDLQLHFGASSFLNIEQPVVYAELDMTVKYAGDSNVLTFKLIITNDAASVGSIVSDGNNVSFYNNSLIVNIAKSSTLEVYSATGARVKAVAGVKNTTVDLSHLPTGIYIYRVANKSGKIIVRH
jgi:hypothetical protein